eukprot:1662230-Pyramimonas_sp.AAC.1
MLTSVDPKIAVHVVEATRCKLCGASPDATHAAQSMWRQAVRCRPRGEGCSVQAARCSPFGAGCAVREALRCKLRGASEPPGENCAVPTARPPAARGAHEAPTRGHAAERRHTRPAHEAPTRRPPGLGVA